MLPIGYPGTSRKQETAPHQLHVSYTFNFCGALLLKMDYIDFAIFTTLIIGIGYLLACIGIDIRATHKTLKDILDELKKRGEK